MGQNKRKTSEKIRRGKGTIVMLVAIIILLAVEAVVFSFAFNRVSIQVREFSDATIVYEGSQIEAFARSIDASIEPAVVQGMYEFYVNHRGAMWGNYDDALVPDDDSVSELIKGYAIPHIDSYLVAHKGAAELKKLTIQTGSGISELKMSPNGVSSPGSLAVVLPEVLMTKTLEDLAKTNYERRFTPGTSMTTALPDMFAFIRENIVGSKNMLNSQTALAIGYPGTEIKSVMERLSYPRRGGGEFGSGYDAPKEREMMAYIDKNTGCTASSGDGPGHRACLKMTQTDTKGGYKYCSTERDVRQCAAANPCPNRGVTGPEEDPSPEKVYGLSHGGQSFSTASQLIKKYGLERILYSEFYLDSATPIFTVAFDGNNFDKDGQFDAIENSISLDSKVTGSCSYSHTGNKCGGQRGETCGVTPSGTVLYWYQCYKEKKAVCDYGHFVKADVAVRAQEDGFTYGIWDIEKGKPAADTPKVVFKTIAGNGKGVIG